MSDFALVANVGEVTDPGSMLIEVDDRLLVLIRAAGHFYALDDVCTHDGGPLSDGPIDPSRKSIACARHGAKFDITTGAALTMPATRATLVHEVKVEDGQIFVRITE